MKGAFLTFQKDADQIYPGWKEKLGYTGESSVQAASFDWKKKSAAAAFYANGARGILGTTVNQFMFTHPDQQKQEYIADSGYFADGTSLVGAGNALFRSRNTSWTRATSPMARRWSGPVTPSSGRPCPTRTPLTPLCRSQNTSRTRAASPAESRSTGSGTLSSAERAKIGDRCGLEEVSWRMRIF